MTRSASTAIAWLMAAGLMATLTAAATTAEAQQRAPGARAATAPARTPPATVRGGAGGARSPVVRARSAPAHRSARVVVGAPLIAAQWPYQPYPYPYSYPYPYAYRYDYGYDPYFHPLPAYVYQEPMVYLEQTPPSAAAQAPEPYWYYCQDSKTYYPYVQTCATPWQRVLPHAPQ